jgi:two-component system response regulator YesN
VVESEKISLDILSTVLKRKYPEFTIYSAMDGRAGLESFRVHKPDIVVTEIRIPELGGVQMVDEMRTILPGTKFIVITGDSERIECQESVGKGFQFDAYIVKPVAFQELFAAIERCFGELAKRC